MLLQHLSSQWLLQVLHLRQRSPQRGFTPHELERCPTLEHVAWVVWDVGRMWNLEKHVQAKSSEGRSEPAWWALCRSQCQTSGGQLCHDGIASFLHYPRNSACFLALCGPHLKLKINATSISALLDLRLLTALDWCLQTCLGVAACCLYLRVLYGLCLFVQLHGAQKAGAAWELGSRMQRKEQDMPLPASAIRSPSNWH